MATKEPKGANVSEVSEQPAVSDEWNEHPATEGSNP